MDAGPSEPLAGKDVVTDLQAAVEARRELGGELEEQVLEAFLARVQHRIDAQVAEQLAKSGGKPPVEQRKGTITGWMWPVGLILSFPLVAAAANFAGVLGVLVVMVGLVVLTRTWLDYSKR